MTLLATSNFLTIAIWLAMIPDPIRNEKIPLNHKDLCGAEAFAGRGEKGGNIRLAVSDYIIDVFLSPLWQL
jgi:hypothetical protein